MDNIYLIAAAWIGLALVASVISLRLGISVALVELFLGVIAGNFLHFQTAAWIDVLASFGSVLLTFLAGAEIDPESLRRHLKPSLTIGAVSFLLPFLGALTFTYRRIRLSAPAFRHGGKSRVARQGHESTASRGFRAYQRE